MERPRQGQGELDRELGGKNTETVPVITSVRASTHPGEREDTPFHLMLFLFYSMNTIVTSMESKSDSLNLNDGISVSVQTPPQQPYK